MKYKALLTAATLTGIIGSTGAMAQESPTIAVVAKVGASPGSMPWKWASNKWVKSLE